MTNQLSFELLQRALASDAAAFRCITDYQPAGGVGDKVFPPTYEGGKYAMEQRIDPLSGELRDCVLLDSVQSQANRMEMALLEACEAGRLALPLLSVKFEDTRLLREFSVTSLEAPHRVADALFRDSRLKGTIFRKSETGRILDFAEVRNAAGLFGICPTALVFGMWDSTGPRGGLGAKFQRALVSEIVGFDAREGVRTSSRIDPAQTVLDAGPLYHRTDSRDDAPNWTLKEGGKRIGSGKSPTGRPSEANHGNVTPSISAGGVVISKARQTTTLSLAVLRRLRFPLQESATPKNEIDMAARTTLAALGLTAGTLARNDLDLRSRCHLFPVAESRWQLLDLPSEPPAEFNLDVESSLAILNSAIEDAKEKGLPWAGNISLDPSNELLELVIKSQKAAAETEPAIA